MKQQITILTLGVKNLVNSKRFYEGILGWVPTDQSNDNITFYKLNGFLLSLYPIEKLAEDANAELPIKDHFKGFTMAINLESEQAVDELIDQLKKQDVKIEKEPHKAFWGGYSSYFSDPDKHLWEVAHNPFL